MKIKTYGQIGFEAYGERANWTAYDGKPMPRWDDALRPDIKEKWEAAAKAISDAAVATFTTSACMQCRNPDHDGMCECEFGKPLVNSHS